MREHPGASLYRQIKAENADKRAADALRAAETADGDGDFITAAERRETAEQALREANQLRKR